MSARERYEGYWRTTLEAGVRAGDFGPVPSLLVKGILGMFNYTYLWYDADGPVSTDELARMFLDAVFDGISPTPGS